MPDHNQFSDLFTTIDRATCWVYVEHKTVRERIPLLYSPTSSGNGEWAYAQHQYSTSFWVRLAPLQASGTSPFL